ncbi:MAG: MSCRAMM family protein [Chitinophagaceae bacterium]
MKKNILTSLLALSTFTVIAQEPIVVSIGGGFNSTSSSLKSKVYLGNGYNLQGDVFIPFVRKGRDGSVKGSSKFTWGAIVGGTWFTSKNLMPDIASTQATYQLYSGSLNIVNDQKGGSFNNGFIASAGLQTHFSLGHISFSPSVRGGYFSIKQNGFAQRSTASSTPIVLTELSKTKNTGFTFIPEIRIGYLLTGNLRIFTSASLQLGPAINTVGRRLVPAGGFNDQNTYEQDQLASGTMKERSIRTTYQSLNINAGVSWSIGRSSRRLRGKVTKPGDNGAFAKPGNPIGGIIVKGGKNPGPRDMIAVSNENGEITFSIKEAGEYSFQVVTAETQGKSISSKGVMGNPPKQNKRTGRTYTGGRKNEVPDQDIQALPGTPIGGIVVKGGKNPGLRDMIAVSNENGEITFPIKEAGEYSFQVITPDTQGKSISSKGVMGNPPKQNKRTGRTYTGGRKNEVSDQDIQALPGTPIGGIVVKGGKNPGGNLMTITSNDKGEFELNGLESGNYRFTLTSPDGSQGKSISEKGVKRNETAEEARPGTPIGGIVVKGGKNPGGNMTNLSVDKDGTIEFEVLEPGNYKFIIQAPENMNENKKGKEKVKEKATSGLKDVLKTNV